MLLLAEHQQRFATALLAPDMAVPPGMVGPAGSVGAERFAVYRNNVAVGLIEALRSAFPVVNRLVGDEFFGAMAGVYSRLNPPSTPVLLAYGGSFPDFVATFEPADALPYLADVARFEWQWLESYHAADAEPLAIGGLSDIATARLPALRLTLHPSVRFIRLACPARAIWLAHQDEDEPGEIAIGQGPEHCLFVRARADVATFKMSSGALVFLEAVRADATIADAVAEAIEEEPAIVIADLFSFLFEAGVFAGFVQERTAAKSSAEGDR